MGIGAGTAAAISATTAIIGAGVSAAGAISQGMAQSDAAKYQAQVARNNALVAQQNADAVQRQAEAKAVADQRAGTLRLGAQRAAMGASGGTLDSGTALDVQRDTAASTEQASQQDEYQGMLAAYGYNTQASNYTAQAGLDTMQGDSAMTGGIVSGAGSMLSGASQVAGKWASWQMQTPQYGAPQMGGYY